MTTQTREERDKQNMLLREHGYRWGKEGNQWRLLDPRGQVVTLDGALTAIELGTVKKPEPIYSHVNRTAALLWAHALANRPQHARPVVVLDTETSGVDMTDVVLQLGIVNLRGDVLMDTLIHPDGTTISEKAQATHGLSLAVLDKAPTFPTIWERLRAILEVSDLVVYNAAFDIRLLSQTANKYGLPMPLVRSHCLMQQYNMYIGEISSAPLRPLEYKMQSLAAACEHFGIVPGTHQALDDAIAAKDVLLAMAKEYEA